MDNLTDISSTRDSKYTDINATIDYKKSVSPITKIKDLPSKFDYEIDSTLIVAYIFGIDIIVGERDIAFLTLKLSDMTGSIIARLVIPSNSLIYKNPLWGKMVSRSCRIFDHTVNPKIVLFTGG